MRHLSGAGSYEVTFARTGRPIRLIWQLGSDRRVRAMTPSSRVGSLGGQIGTESPEGILHCFIETRFPESQPPEPGILTVVRGFWLSGRDATNWFQQSPLVPITQGLQIATYSDESRTNISSTPTSLTSDRVWDYSLKSTPISLTPTPCSSPTSKRTKSLSRSMRTVGNCPREEA